MTLVGRAAAGWEVTVAEDWAGGVGEAVRGRAAAGWEVTAAEGWAEGGGEAGRGRAAAGWEVSVAEDWAGGADEAVAGCRQAGGCDGNAASAYASAAHRNAAGRVTPHNQRQRSTPLDGALNSREKQGVPTDLGGGGEGGGGGGLGGGGEGEGGGGLHQSRHRRQHVFIQVTSCCRCVDREKTVLLAAGWRRMGETWGLVAAAAAGWAVGGWAEGTAMAVAGWVAAAEEKAMATAG